MCICAVCQMPDRQVCVSYSSSSSAVLALLRVFAIFAHPRLCQSSACLAAALWWVGRRSGQAAVEPTLHIVLILATLPCPTLPFPALRLLMPWELVSGPGCWTWLLSLGWLLAAGS